MKVRRRVAAYGVSLAAAAAAVGARMLLDPLLGDGIPFVTLYFGVALAAWYGGRGLALVAMITTGVAAAYFLLPPRHTFAIDQSEHQVGLVVYGLLSLALIAMFDSLHKAWQHAAENSELLRTTIASIGDAVITTDAQGRVTRMNAVAESLTGWSTDDAKAQPLDAVFRIANEHTRQPVENPATRALREGVMVGLGNHTVLIAKDGTERPIDDSAAPIRGNEGESIRLRAGIPGRDR